MAEATLNNILNAAERIDGSIVCRANITTGTGEIWETDYIVPRPPREGDTTPVELPPVGITKDIYDWAAANPDKVTPYVEGQEPVPREEPVWVNKPPPEPGPPPVDPSTIPPIDEGMQPPDPPVFSDQSEAPAVVEEVPAT